MLAMCHAVSVLLLGGITLGEASEGWHDCSFIPDSFVSIPCIVNYKTSCPLGRSVVVEGYATEMHDGEGNFFLQVRYLLTPAIDQYP